MIRKIITIAGLFAMAALLLSGCQGERGVKGDPGTTTCFGCHDNDNLAMIAIERQWQRSNHGIGATVFENGQSCARCHTAQGFISVHSGGDTVAVEENPSVIHCFACHAPHDNGNFNLRVNGPVTYPMGGTFDGYGNASTCAACHQDRRPNPMYSYDADSLTITSSRWGPHHGVQSDVFIGTHAYIFPGETYDSTSAHNQLAREACINCHMAGPVGDLGGGHTMKVVFEEEGEETELTEGCTVTGCHDGADDFSFAYHGVQDSVLALLATLRSQLLAESLITEAGRVNASTSAPLRVPMDVAGAIFNYYLFNEDRSEGVHNPDYYFDVLNTTIDFMNSRRMLAAN